MYNSLMMVTALQYFLGMKPLLLYIDFTVWNGPGMKWFRYEMVTFVRVIHSLKLSQLQHEQGLSFVYVRYNLIN